MLRKIVAVVGVFVLLAGAVVAGAVLTGTVTVEDPVEAAGEILSGDVQTPEVSIEHIDVGPVGAPTGSVSDADSEGMTVETEFAVNNTMNQVGGTVDTIEYDAYASDDRAGPWEFVGEGRVKDLTVPPNGTVTETNRFDMAYEDFLSATGRTGPGAALGGESYMRIDGEATISIGPASFSVEFERVSEVG